MSQPPRAVPFYDDDDIHDPAFARRGCCCFFFPNLLGKKHPRGGGAAGSSAAFWQRIRPRTPDQSLPWWRRGWKKVSGLSEVGDGPRWKRLIRRFNIRRKRRGYGKFHYDATSYALNFDDGRLDGRDSYYHDEDLHGRGFSDHYDHDINFSS